MITYTRLYCCRIVAGGGLIHVHQMKRDIPYLGINSPYTSSLRTPSLYRHHLHSQERVGNVMGYSITRGCGACFFVTATARLTIINPIIILCMQCCLKDSNTTGMEVS